MAIMIFWLSLILLIYPYVLYPLLLVPVGRIFLRRRARQMPNADWARRAESTPMVSVIIPVHNEEAVLGAKIQNSLSLDYPAERKEIIVACDGCTDASAEIASGYKQDGVCVIASDRRRGKIFAMNLAARQARGDILVFTDARALVDPGALRVIAERFTAPSVGIVSGAIRGEEAQDRRLAPALTAYRWLENRIRWMESEIASSIGATGALYGVRADLFQMIPSDTILDDLVVPLDLIPKGFRTVFDLRATCWLQSSPVSEFSRKIRTLAGNYQALWRHRALLNPFRSAVWWQVLSHKVSRLAAPFLLVSLFVSSMIVPGSFSRTVFGVQCVFYLAAVAGMTIGRKEGRLASLQVPYSLCLLQAANLCGLFKFSFGRLDVCWKKG